MILLGTNLYGTAFAGGSSGEETFGTESKCSRSGSRITGRFRMKRFGLHGNAALPSGKDRMRPLLTLAMVLVARRAINCEIAF